MIIVRTEEGNLFYAATKKTVPGLIQEIAGEKGVEACIQGSEYFEFNTRENRTGPLEKFSPLSQILVVSCGLAPAAGTEDEEEETEG